MSARRCCTHDCQQGRTCHQRIPTVRPAGSKLADFIERHGWWIVVGILVLAVLVNVGA